MKYRIKTPKSKGFFFVDTTKQRQLIVKGGDIVTSYWDNPEFYEEEFDIWTPLRDGEPQEIKILDWENIKKKSFGSRASEYIETSLGWLRIDSTRLNRELVKVKGYKGILILQRWVDETNTRNTFYLIQKKSEASDISTKLPK